MTQFVALAQMTQQSLTKGEQAKVSGDPRATLSEYIRSKDYNANVVTALANVTGNIGEQVKQNGSFTQVPMESVANVRNEMYLASEAIRLIDKNDTVKFDADTKANLKAFKKEIDDATKFIPVWVKVVVAIAWVLAPWLDGNASW